MVSVDVTDISGELQADLQHNIVKTRLTSEGRKVEGSGTSGKLHTCWFFSMELTNLCVLDLKSELDMAAAARGPDYCGSCYGGIEPEGGCCQTCEDVRQAYLNRGWSFSNPQTIDQVCQRPRIHRFHS